jgi:thymidine kinase
MRAAGLQPYGGSIELILGPMFSEKSTELLSRARRAALADQPVVIIKHVKDVRYETADVVATHAEMRQASAPKTESRAQILVVSAGRLSDVALDAGLADFAMTPVVGVDEGQFFPDLIEVCERWANEGRRVIVAALDGSFARTPFNDSCNLVSRCESVTKMRGVCMHCRSRDSAFSLRLGASKELEVIGGREEYHSVCRKCYFADPALGIRDE